MKSARRKKRTRIRFKKIDLPTELKDLVRFDEKIFPPGQGQGDIDKSEWKNFENYWMLANGKRVGCGSLQIGVDYDGTKKRGYIYIVTIGILPKYEGRGFGTEFTRWQVRYALTHGFFTIVTNTRKSNCRMRAIYERLGFKLRRFVKRYYSQPVESAIVMERSLKQTSRLRSSRV